jgi:transcriptional regulator with XRE-family HTH domain
VPEKEIARRVSLEIARLLRNERIRQELSMRRLAKECGLSQPMISYIERGICSPSLDALLRISGALNIDLWKLLKQASKRG